MENKTMFAQLISNYQETIGYMNSYINTMVILMVAILLVSLFLLIRKKLRFTLFLLYGVAAPTVIICIIYVLPMSLVSDMKDNIKSIQDIPSDCKGVKFESKGKQTNENGVAYDRPNDKLIISCNGNNKTIIMK